MSKRKYAIGPMKNTNTIQVRTAGTRHLGLLSLQVIRAMAASSASIEVAKTHTNAPWFPPVTRRSSCIAQATGVGYSTKELDQEVAFVIWLR